MSKRHGPDDRKRLRPDDVLAGRVKAGLAELLDLIHQVNPTGRELGARDAELRYTQKSRLQSLLVRDFGDELTIVADPANEGTVSILHRGHGRDGCHAVIDALDEDARAWVQLQLDLGPPSSEAPPRPVPAARPSGRRLPPPESEDESPSSAEASPPSLAALADEALASYDFERARTYLERALTASGGAAEPAAALLTLLVETLGDDTGALALRPSLTSAALAHPGVRSLLALAAARSGDPEEALALLPKATEQKTAEVSAALAARAVSAGNAEQAAAHLAELRRRDPTHPAIVGLSGEIARLRAAERGPLEAELAALVAAGQEGEAEARAAEVLARWPESEAARRILRAAEERRRLAQEAAEHRAREIEAAHQARREAERVEQVRAQLAAPDPREGLLAWLGLEPVLRRRVGETPAAELCRELELTPARIAPALRVDAVLTLSVVGQRLADDPEGAIEALAPYEATLERVPEARRIVREARAELAVRAAARAREEVVAARRELSGGDAASALLRLDAPSVLRDLAAEDHPEAEALRAEAARIVGWDKRVTEVGRLRRTGHLFEARDLADALGAEAPAEERPRWERERQAIQDEIQRAFRVEIDGEPAPFSEDAAPDASPIMMEACTWLTEDGRTLVLVEGHERWVWIQLVDVESLTARAQVLLRTPEPMGDPVFHVLGHTAWITSTRGGLLAVDVERLTVELFRPAHEIVPPGYSVGAAAITHGRGASRPRYYWIMPADKDGYGYAVQVIDLEARRVVREVPEVHRLEPIYGASEATIGCFKNSGLVLHEERGVPLPGGRFPRQDVSIVHATLHPSGEGLVVAGTVGVAPWRVVRHPVPGARGKQVSPPPAANASAMGIVELTTAGRTRAPYILGAIGDGSLLGLASSRETGLVGAVMARSDLRWELMVLRPGSGTLEQVHRGDVPEHTVLLRDAGARHLFLYSARPLFLAPLGPTAPELPPIRRRSSPWIEDVTRTPACLGSTGARAEAYEQVAESLKSVAPNMVVAASRTLQRESTPELLVERARALALADVTPEAQRLREWLWERHPENARVRVLRADEHARVGLWDEVHEVLSPCTESSFADDEDHAQHFAHLLALAALHRGDLDEATRRLAEARAHHGSCPLEGIAAVLQQRPQARAVLREGTEAPPEPPLLTQLVWALHTADGRLAAGNPEGALAALEPSRFDTGDEVQVLARRAEAWLALSPPRGRRHVAKVMVLARLLDEHERAPDDSARQELPVPGATWDRSRLDDVARRAAAWLEERAAVDDRGTDLPEPV